MILINESSVNNKIYDLTAYVYETALELNEEVHLAREEMMKAEHNAIMQESSYIYNEAKENFFKKIGNAIVTGIQHFLEWIRNAITNLSFHVKASRELKKNQAEIMKGLSIIKEKKDMTFGSKDKPTQVKELKKSAEILKLFDDKANKINMNLNNIGKTNFDYDTSTAKTVENNNLGLKTVGDYEKKPLTVDYFVYDTEGIKDYTSGNSKAVFDVINKLRATEKVLKKKLSEVNKEGSSYEKAAKKAEDGSYDETKNNNMAKNNQQIVKTLSNSMIDINAMYGVIREKFAQLNSFSRIALKAAKGESSDKKKTKEAPAKNEAMVFDW